MRLELQAGGGRGAFDHPGEAGRGERRCALADEEKGDAGLSRSSWRRARSSIPWIVWVLAVPFLTRRT
jgi:hypothetical protein